MLGVVLEDLKRAVHLVVLLEMELVTMTVRKSCRRKGEYGLGRKLVVPVVLVFDLTWSMMRFRLGKKARRRTWCYLSGLGVVRALTLL